LAGVQIGQCEFTVLLDGKHNQITRFGPLQGNDNGLHLLIVLLDLVVIETQPEELVTHRRPFIAATAQ
jgi:hypothetical protein